MASHRKWILFVATMNAAPAEDTNQCCNLMKNLSPSGEMGLEGFSILPVVSLAKSTSMAPNPCLRKFG